jgi:hypothetical protein
MSTIAKLAFYMLEVQGHDVYTLVPPPREDPAFAVAAQLLLPHFQDLAALPDATPVVLRNARGEVVGTSASGRPRYRTTEVGRFALGDFRRLGGPAR